MKLLMFMGNECIDSITIEQSFIILPGYTSHFVRLLKQRNERLLSQLKREPEFLFYNYSFDMPAQVFEMVHDYCGIENKGEYKRAV